MYRLRKILSILLLFVMVLSFIPEGALVFDFKAKAAYSWSGTENWSDDDTEYLSGKPGVYIMGDGYAIIWVTTFTGTGSVTYMKDGAEVTINDERTGIIRTNDTIHVVKIPLDEWQYVQENGYYIYSRKVTDHNYAVTNYGTQSVTAGPIKVAATPNGITDEDPMNVTVLPDIHSDVDATYGPKAVANRIKSQFYKGGADPDLYVFPGDVVDKVESKDHVEDIFEIMGNITEGRVPSVYIRGNHECRDIASTLLLEYLPTKTGQFYFDFKYGPLWGVVIDTVEDKNAQHRYYGNSAQGDFDSTGTVLNYEQYLIEQQKWLRSLQKDTTAQVRLGIYHIPDLSKIGYSTDNKSTLSNYTGISSSYAVDLSGSIHHLGIDFAISGHNHTAVPSYTYTSVKHDSYVCGGHVKNENAAYATANGTNALTFDANSGKNYIEKYVGTSVKLAVGQAIMNAIFYNGYYYGRSYYHANGVYTGQHQQNIGIRYPAHRETENTYKNNKTWTNSTDYSPETLTDNRFYFNSKFNKFVRSGTSYAGNYNGEVLTNEVIENNKIYHFLKPGVMDGYEISSSDKTDVPALSIAVQPTVFETGDDYYNVVWVSNIAGYAKDNVGTPTKGAIGYVQLSYQGEVYQFFDEVAGVRRAYDNIHTVKIPKEYLNNNRYFVGSLAVRYRYTGDDSTGAGTRYYEVGAHFATSKEYLFQDRSNDKTPNILTYTDLKFPTNNDKGFVKEATDALGTSPSLIVVAGNAVQTTTGDSYPSIVKNSDSTTTDCQTTISDITGIIVNDPMADRDDKKMEDSYTNLYTNAAFHDASNYNMIPEIFSATASVSGGEHLVIFSRGANECRGMFATDLIRYIPTITEDGFHYTVNIGDFTYLNMDTNEDEYTAVKTADGSSKYGGRIDPDALKLAQDEYITSIFGGVQRNGENKYVDGITGYTDAHEPLKDKVVVISGLALGMMDDRTSEKRLVKNITKDNINNMGFQWSRYLKQHGAIISLTRPALNENLAVADGEKTLFKLLDNVHERQMFTVRSGGYVAPGYKPNGGEVDYYSVATSVLLSEEYAHISSCTSWGQKTIKWSKDVESISYVEDHSPQYQFTDTTVSLVTGEEINYAAEEPQLVDKTYYLSKPSHLVWMAEKVNDDKVEEHFSGYTFELKNDIDLMLKPFTPIGGYNDELNTTNDNLVLSNYFSGTVLGNGYKIKNLHILPGLDSKVYVDRFNYYKDSNDKLENNVGLFGAIKNGAISQLTVEGGFVKGSVHTGALAGLVEGTIDKGLENCYTNVIVYGPGGTGYGATAVGGFVGQITDNVIIESCANYGNVIVSKSGNYSTQYDNGANAGGIMGALYTRAQSSSYTSQILNTYNRGHILSTGNGNLGGIIGRIARLNFYMENCYNASSVISSSDYDVDNNKIGAIFGAAGTNSSSFYSFYVINCVFDHKYNGGATIARYLRLAGNYHIGTGDTKSFPENGWMQMDNTNKAATKQNVVDGEGSVLDIGSRVWYNNQADVSDWKSKLNDYDQYGKNKYVDDGTLTNGENINDGYPIHGALIINEEPEVVTRPNDYEAEQDAFDKINDDSAYANNVNEQFSVNGNNITDLTAISGNFYMYVLLMDEDGKYKNAGSNSSLADANQYVWKLQKSGTQWSIYNLYSKTKTNITLSKESDNFTEDEVDTLYKDNLYNISGTKYHVFPLLQDNDNDAKFGFSGEKDLGVSSTISSLSVSTAHKVLRDHGLTDRLYNSAYGNNIFYYSVEASPDANIQIDGYDQCFVVDMLSLGYRQTTAPWHLPQSYMTAPDATGQLMDMACDNATYSWEISPSNAANAALTYNGGSVMFDADGESGQKFFIAYSLNADGGYYLIPANAGANTLSVGDAINNTVTPESGEAYTVVSHELTSNAFNNSSKDRFWIQSNQKQIVAEVVDVLVRFDRYGNIFDNIGTKGNKTFTNPVTGEDFTIKDLYKYVEIREETRFTNVLYQNSAFYNPDGFWTDIYKNVNDIEYVYAFDSIDVVSPTNIVCYRYFRPKVYHVVYQSNLPQNPVVDRENTSFNNKDANGNLKSYDNGKLEVINTDVNGNPTRYYFDDNLKEYDDIDVRKDSSLNDWFFTHDFAITYNSNGGTDVVTEGKDYNIYSYDLASWYYKAGNKDNIEHTSSLNSILNNESKEDHFEIVLLANWNSTSVELPKHADAPTREKHVFYGWSDLTKINKDGDRDKSITAISATHDENTYPIRKATKFNAFWVGGDLSGVLDQRTDHTKNTDKLTAVAKVYGADTTLQGSNGITGFTEMQENAYFKWYRVTVDENVTTTDNPVQDGGNYYSEYAPKDKVLFEDSTSDRGSAIKAQLHYKDNPATSTKNDDLKVEGVYAFSALIATNQIVDGDYNTSTDENKFFALVPVVNSNTTISGTSTFNIDQSDVDNFKSETGIISGVWTSLSGLTYKVYGVWGNDKILIVDNGVQVMDLDGRVSYEGVDFDSYVVEVTGNATLTKDNFKILVNPRIYEVVLKDANGNIIETTTDEGEVIDNIQDVEYVVNVSGDKWQEGERAWQKSTNKSFYYKYDKLRVKLPIADGEKFAAGTHLIIDNVLKNDVLNSNIKVFPTYTTTSTGNYYPTVGANATTDDNVYIDKLNGIDAILKLKDFEYIIVGNKDMTINIFSSTVENVYKGDNQQQSINIGPMGIKSSLNTTDGIKRIRFGTIWYLDDVTTEYRWYRDYTVNNVKAFGTYIIIFDNLLKFETENDFLDYLNTNSNVEIGNTGKTGSQIIAMWNEYVTEDNVLTEPEKEDYKAKILAALAEFIDKWNTTPDEQRINDTMSFGKKDSTPIANDFKSTYYYYYKGDMDKVVEDTEKNGNPDRITEYRDGVREAFIEYSAVLQIPENMVDRELIYIPYASYVYKWNYGFYTDYSTHPDNIFVYGTPQEVYTYNDIANVAKY